MSATFQICSSTHSINRYLAWIWFSWMDWLCIYTTEMYIFHIKYFWLLDAKKHELLIYVKYYSVMSNISHLICPLYLGRKKHDYSFGKFDRTNRQRFLFINIDDDEIYNIEWHVIVNIPTGNIIYFHLNVELCYLEWLYWVFFRHAASSCLYK